MRVKRSWGLPPNMISMCLVACVGIAGSMSGVALQVTYAPYIQPGDASTLGALDQMVIAFQTDETSPNPAAFTVQYGKHEHYGQTATVAGRVVDNYLSADNALPAPAQPFGAHSDYYAVLGNLEQDTTYYYRVTGPGLPSTGFAASFHTRKASGPIAFEIMGDEGFFPSVPNATPARNVNYEARIIHEMNTVDTLQVTNLSHSLPKPAFLLNTGDNVYSEGSEDNYRDFYFSVWNNNVDSNETGAPLLRHLVNYIVAGNHDFGGTGDYVNLFGDSSAAAPFTGGASGSSMLACFNDYYYPLNGPVGADPMYVLNGDTSSTPDGFRFTANGQTYSSPAAIEAFRASTAVNTGGGNKRQIDTMSDYSFDQGDVHFVFLDSNPHVFNAQVDYSQAYVSPPVGFPQYPSVLGQWLIHDLDSSTKRWKVVVFHHPAVSSGNSSLRNYQMRGVYKLFEDHGVNFVFNGHEHNYQRTYPLRTLPGFDQAPGVSGAPVVAIDTVFDGRNSTVPDGLITLVEGAGGNRDFDDDLPAPRGNGLGLADQDDAATGTTVVGNNQAYPNGPASWLDNQLTSVQMSAFFPKGGTGPKITALFKTKLFSFAHVVADNDSFTLNQISEPLQSSTSATATKPYPFGTDVTGAAANDPIPDTQLDAVTGAVISTPAIGTPDLLDAFTVKRPDLAGKLVAKIIASDDDAAYLIKVTNHSGFAINGTQVVLTLPPGVVFAGAESGTLSLVNGNTVVVSLSRLAPSDERTLSIPVQGLSALRHGNDEAPWGRRERRPALMVRSSTALPVVAHDH